MNTTNIYSVKEILAILSLTPEAFLRDYGRIRILDPNSRNPQFVPVLKGNDDIVGLSGDAVDIMSIGFAGGGNLRLSVTGDIPIELAEQILDAINWRVLETDDTGNSTYGFFYANGDSYSHFLKLWDNPGVSRISDTCDKVMMTKFEFAGLSDGILTLSIIADNRAYQTDVKLADIWGINTPKLRWIGLDTNVDVLDISSRVVDDKVITMLATKDGIFVCLDNKEIVHYEETRGMVVPAVSGWFAGRYHSPQITKADDKVGCTIGFIGYKGTEIGFYIAPLKPEGKMTPVSLDPNFYTNLKLDDGRVIPGNDYRWYVGAGDKTTVVPTT